MTTILNSIKSQGKYNPFIKGVYLIKKKKKKRKHEDINAVP